MGATGGVLLGSAVGAVVTTALDHAAVNSWGWRLAFLLGLLVGGIGFAIRRQLADDRAAPGGMPPAASPVRDAFRTQWRTILRVVGLNAAGAVAYYMTFVYVTTYLRQIDFITASKALDINTIAVLALMLAIVPMGRLSDRIGRRPVLLAATGGLFVLAVPLFWMLHHTDPAILLIGQIGFAVLNAAYWGPSTATMVELVPGHIRCTVMSVGYNLGLAILGGATPMVAVYVIHRSDNDLSPAFVIMAVAAVSFLVILGLRESNKATLAGPAPPSCREKPQTAPIRFVPGSEVSRRLQRKGGPRSAHRLSGPYRVGFNPRLRVHSAAWAMPADGSAARWRDRPSCRLP